jgi:hypothetical protein
MTSAAVFIPGEAIEALRKPCRGCVLSGSGL